MAQHVVTVVQLNLSDIEAGESENAQIMRVFGPFPTRDLAQDFLEKEVVPVYDKIKNSYYGSDEFSMTYKVDELTMELPNLEHYGC